MSEPSGVSFNNETRYKRIAEVLRCLTSEPARFGKATEGRRARQTHQDRNVVARNVRVGSVGNRGIPEIVEHVDQCAPRRVQESFERTSRIVRPLHSFQ